MYVVIVQPGYQGTTARINRRLPWEFAKVSTDFIDATLSTTHIQTHDPVEFDLANQQHESSRKIRLIVRLDEKWRVMAMRVSVSDTIRLYSALKKVIVERRLRYPLR